jgi:uncharacterized protein YhbP (UPF0306 family)
MAESAANARELVQEFLRNDEIMQLATVRDGRPWICTVHFLAEDGRLYWTSTRDRRHSQELTDNPRVAVAVVHNTAKPQAVQMAGQAHEVPANEVRAVYDRYCLKFGPKAAFLAEIEAGKRTFYAFVPEETVIFDVVNFPQAPRQVAGGN